MNGQVATVFTLFLYVLIALIIARSLLSWFPAAQGSQLARLLYRMTEPLLEPIRRIVPRTGIIDFSALIVIVLLYVMIAVVNQAADR